MTIRELLVAFSKKSGNELRDICRENLDKVHGYLVETRVSEEYRQTFVQGIWKLFVSADRKTRGDEYNLFIYSIGFTKEEFSQDQFYDMTNEGSDENFVNWMIRETNKMPKDIAFAVCTIGVCIMSVDEDVSDSEVELLSKFFR